MDKIWSIYHRWLQRTEGQKPIFRILVAELGIPENHILSSRIASTCGPSSTTIKDSNKLDLWTFNVGIINDIYWFLRGSPMQFSPYSTKMAADPEEPYLLKSRTYCPMSLHHFRPVCGWFLENNLLALSVVVPEWWGSTGAVWHIPHIYTWLQRASWFMTCIS